MTGAINIDPESVIRRMAERNAQLSVELAMRDAALDAAHARIAELEAVGPVTPDEGSDNSE